MRACFLLFSVACTATEPAPTGSADTGGPPADTWDDSLGLRGNCFAELGDVANGFPDYDALGITPGHHCNGTNHQDITDVGKLIFLGDSITEGTPPTPSDEVYRNVLTDALTERFGTLDVANCAKWGARTDDLLLPPHEQIIQCVPDVQTEPTLVVMTMGGNDMFAFAEDFANGATEDEVVESIDQAAEYMREALQWFRDNEATMFPNGVNIIFGNVYEFTDATGDMGSCPMASSLGFDADVPGMRDAYIRINEQYLSAAVATQTDAIFMLEQFCGHGFYAGDPNNECYRGPDAETWFDATCIHPNPAGHAALSAMFMDVIEE